MRRPLRALASIVALLAACGGNSDSPSVVDEVPDSHGTTAEDGGAPNGEMELVESAPVETTLGHDDIPDAADVWPAMMGRARRTIDIGAFYASDAEDGEPTKLTTVLDAIDAAIGRGVRVRVLADAGFATTYPATLARFEKSGAEVRKLKFGTGEMHAKYFVIDDTETYVGSQNFDWRSLEHIQEIGLRMSGPPVAFVHSIFATDWQAAGGEADETSVATVEFPTSLESGDVTLAASPEKKLPEGASWDLSRLVAHIDQAKERVAVQVLTYDAARFTQLDDALRRAAERGVAVRVLVSDWSTATGTSQLTSLQALAEVSNVEVRVITVPPWSGGDVPYARVAHAKFAVFDEEAAWIGTANWESSFFQISRNLSVFVEKTPIVSRLGHVFDDDWQSPYSARLSAP